MPQPPDPNQNIGARNAAQILKSIETLLQQQNSKLAQIDRKLGDIKLKLGANY